MRSVLQKIACALTLLSLGCQDPEPPAAQPVDEQTEELLGPIAGGDDCSKEWKICSHWCDVIFCSWTSGAGCFVCQTQCYQEFLDCRLYF